MCFRVKNMKEYIKYYYIYPIKRAWEIYLKNEVTNISPYIETSISIFPICQQNLLV